MTKIFDHACERKHERSVGARCIYFKQALEKCKELGAPPDDYKLYLPDLEVPPTSPSVVLKQPMELTTEEIKAIFVDNQECKRQVMETNRQMGVLIQQMADLTVALSDCTTISNMAPQGVQGSVCAGNCAEQVCVTSSMASTMRSTPAITPSITTPVTVPTVAVNRPITSNLPSWMFPSTGAMGFQTGNIDFAAGVPTPGVLTSAQGTVFSGNLQNLSHPSINLGTQGTSANRHGSLESNTSLGQSVATGSTAGQQAAAGQSAMAQPWWSTCAASTHANLSV